MEGWINLLQQQGRMLISEKITDIHGQCPHLQKQYILKSGPKKKRVPPLNSKNAIQR